MSEKANPLAKYFRQPQIYIKLPSGGRWYAENSLEMPATKELPVLAMTARDEIAVKTPDALLNGQSTVDLIESCVPAIKNAWNVPSVDMDALLIAIRIATYGPRMSINSVCPHCNTQNEHDVDLGFLTSTIKCPDYDTTVKLQNLEIFLKPQTYKTVNDANIKTFEEQRLIRAISDDNLTEAEKLEKFNVMFKTVLNLTVKQVSGNVAAIKTEDGTVVEDPEMLADFFTNCDKGIWNAVKDRLQELANEAALKPVPVECENSDCAKEYKVPLVFEHSNFFA